MTYWAHKHECVSCQFWNGPRNVKSDPRVVETPPRSTGMCCGKNRYYRGKQVQASLHIGGEACFVLWNCLSER